MPFVESLPPSPTTPFQTKFFTSMIDEDMPHRTCRKTEEMPPVGKITSRTSGDLDVRLVNQLCCVQGLPPLTTKLSSGKGAEFVVKQSEYSIPCLLITLGRSPQ